MTQSRRYALKYRRRRQQRTDYKKRLALLKSRQVRVVIRKSNAHTLVQFIQYEPDGDVVVAQASTKELAELGWKQSTGNLPAAYLAGLLAGKKASDKKVKEAVADLGMQVPASKGRLFSALKGVIDAGVSVPVSKDALPQESRLQGEHIDKKVASEVETIKKKVL